MRYIYTLILALCLASTMGCNDKRLYDGQANIPQEGWSYDNIPEFRFNVLNTKNYHNIYLNLRVKEDYKYENLYVLAHLRDPDGKVETRQVSLTLSDATGKPTGSGMGDIQSYQLPLIPNKAFKKPGEYIIAIEQNMRDTMLKDIMNVGVMIKEGEPVF